MGIKPLQLFGVKGGRCAVQAGSVEQVNQLVHGENFLISVRPAKTDQVIDQSLRQKPVLFVFDHGACPMTLGEFLPVRPEYHGYMAKRGEIKAQGLIQQYLLGGVGNVIVAAQHMGHAHVMIIHHHGHIVCGHPVRPAQHHVVQLGHIHGDMSFNHVIEDNTPFIWNAETNNPAFPGAKPPFTAPSIITRLLSLGPGYLTHGLHLFRGTVAPVSVPACKKLVHI